MLSCQANILSHLEQPKRAKVDVSFTFEPITEQHQHIKFVSLGLLYFMNKDVVCIVSRAHF